MRSQAATSARLGTGLPPRRYHPAIPHIGFSWPRRLMATVGMNDKTDRDLRVWALLGPHRGDNNQVLALAEALGLPFEEKWLSYNQLRRIQPSLLGATFRSVSNNARPPLQAEPPDLTISTGLRSVPVVRELRR